MDRIDDIAAERRIRVDLSVFIDKMTAANLPEKAIEYFSTYYLEMRSGAEGQLPESEIEPVFRSDISDYADTEPFRTAGKALLDRAVILKLNGGLGTTMGCDGPKSLIEVKPGHTFLSIAVERSRKLSTASGVRPVLVLMNSFHTDYLTHEALARHGAEDPTLLTFIQNKFPKVSCENQLPAVCPQQPALEWNPPGHGDLFSAIDTSGTLNDLLARNYRYAFISNIDNVGAELDAGILGYMAEQGIEFLMEVADRTASDRKGGHLARRRRDNRLVLRESAQCPEGDRETFRDIGRHQLFNTNNIWIDLKALRNLLDSNNGLIKLPLICNRKTLDPVDSSTAPVIQLETAMGAGISLFNSSDAVRVPRSRFIPVKSCDDLLVVRSDAFTFTEDFTLLAASGDMAAPPDILLERAFYTTVDQLAAHFPFGPPSLRGCRSLRVEGEVIFGANIRITGDVTISNPTGQPRRIPDNSHIYENLVLQ
jgi:UTP--glucose-1-phosphate uridylyltransferase